MTMTEETRSKRIKFNRSHFNNQPTYSVHGSKFTKKKKKKMVTKLYFSMASIHIEVNVVESVC